VRGRKNWAYRLARRAEQGRDPELAYHRLIAADAVAAGVLDEAEIEDARRLLPAHIFEELYEARASDDGGNPFGEQHIRACVAPMSNGQPIVWGWDLAKRQDFTVGIALDAEGAACRFERFQRIPWDEIMRRITSATRGAPALVDSTGLGDPVLGLLQKTPGSRFEGYHFHQTSKQKLMEGLAVAIQSRTVTFPDGPIALELSQFEYQYTRTGCTYGAPEGFHDDCVVALALAVEHKAHARRPLVISDRVLERIRMYPRRPGRWPCRMPSLGA